MRSAFKVLGQPRLVGLSAAYKVSLVLPAPQALSPLVGVRAHMQKGLHSLHVAVKGRRGSTPGPIAHAQASEMAHKLQETARKISPHPFVGTSLHK